MSSTPSLSLSSLLGIESIFYLNATPPPDHSHLCSLKCHHIFFPYRPGLTRGLKVIKSMLIKTLDIKVYRLDTFFRNLESVVISTTHSHNTVRHLWLCSQLVEVISVISLLSQVKCETDLSSWYTSSSGVLQGSVFGPLLCHVHHSSQYPHFLLFPKPSPLRR